MRRREFITLLGGAAAAWPVVARAQQNQSSAVRPLIGVLSQLSAAAAAHNIAAFRAALRDLGYVEGRSATLELRYGDGAPERMAPLANELVALKPDVLFAAGKAAALAARRATQTIPIVMTTPEDPIASGLANTIAKPGGNITGTWLLGDDALVGKRLELLLLAVPALSRVGIIVNPDDPSDALTVTRLPEVARALGVTVEKFAVRDVSTLDGVSAQIVRAGVQGVLVGPGPMLVSSRAAITRMVAQLSLPGMYGFREFADVGGLMSYGPNLPDLHRQSARLVGRILKGEQPAELPIELPTRYELIVNLKTAKAIRLEIPDSFLLLADEQANPGKINMASPGSGSTPHVNGELFKVMTGTNMVHVPYRSAAAVMTDLLSGQVQLYFGTTASSLEYVRTGKLRPLAVTTERRLNALPDIPAVAEFVPGYEATSWYGVGAPKGTSMKIIEKLNKEIDAGVADSKIKARLADLGGLALTGSSSDFGKLIVEETEKWATVIKFAGIKAD
jgi:putative ABC transport system substrate-binding protein